MWNNRILLLAAAALLSLQACKNENGGNTGGTPPPDTSHAVVVPAKLAPPFSEDSAYKHIETQLAFGPRIPGSPGHTQCLEWMKASFSRFTPHVIVQDGSVKAYDGKTLPIRNLIASFLPDHPQRLIVSAHWDSRPWADKDAAKPYPAVPGANDGASGVAVILEIARHLAAKAPTVGVDLMLWDTEDYGDYNSENTFCYGSQYWTKNMHKPGYSARWGMNLDMVGAANATFYQETNSLQIAMAQTQSVWATAAELGYSEYFPLSTQSYPVIDDHLYLIQNAGIPMVEIIDRDNTNGAFFEHWHKSTDDLSQISKPTLKAVGQTVLEMIYREK